MRWSVGTPMRKCKFGLSGIGPGDWQTGPCIDTRAPSSILPGRGGRGPCIAAFPSAPQSSSPSHVSSRRFIMSAVLDQVLSANTRYAADFGDKRSLALPPARRFAVLTCMDARIDPAKALGLREGDAHVIRNAGGRASDDAIRSLVISHKLLGTNEWFVIHHTNCGRELFTDEVMRGLLAQSLDTASVDASGWHDRGKGPGSRQGAFIDWLTIRAQAESVRDDVQRIREHPLVPKNIAIFGYIYDVKTGRIIEVPAASALGRGT